MAVVQLDGAGEWTLAEIGAGETELSVAGAVAAGEQTLVLKASRSAPDLGSGF